MAVVNTPERTLNTRFTSLGCFVVLKSDSSEDIANVTEVMCGGSSSSSSSSRSGCCCCCCCICCDTMCDLVAVLACTCCCSLHAALLPCQTAFWCSLFYCATVVISHITNLACVFICPFVRSFIRLTVKM